MLGASAIGSAAVRRGVKRKFVTLGGLVVTFVLVAGGSYALGGLTSRYSMLILFLPIIALYSLSPRVIILTGVMTVVTIATLYVLNDTFPTDLRMPKHHLSLHAAVSGLIALAVTWGCADFARSVKHAPEDAVSVARKEFAAAKYGALATMAGSVAHEIANPLAILKGHVEVLMASIQAGRPDNIEARLASVERTSGRLQRLIKILATMGDPERGYGPQEVEFHTIVSDALTLLAGATESTGVQVERKGPDLREKIWIRGNRALVTTILFELIQSSIQVAKDSATKSIVLNTERAPAHTLVVIKAGHSITEEEVGRLTRTLNVSLMQLLTSSMGGSLSITHRPGCYEQRLLLKHAQPQKS